MVVKELEALMGEESFLRSDEPTCVLDENFVFRAVNHAYTTLTGCPVDELLSRELFTVFPENPDAPESDGHLQIRLSGERVMRERQAHHLLLQRYDIPDRSAEGVFLPRFWAPVNRPFLVDGAARGVINRVQPVEPPEPQTLQTVQALREAMGGGFFQDEPADEDRIEAFMDTVRRINGLGREVTQLREALVSRATIEQAKGIIMAERQCTPDEAFKILVKLSNDTNVRVAEVAQALVYRSQSEGT